MKPVAALLIAALYLAPGAALAGGEGGSSPFGGQEQKPSAELDPGFDTAVRFFALFLKGGGIKGSSEVAVIPVHPCCKEHAGYELFNNTSTPDQAGQRRAYFKRVYWRGTRTGPEQETKVVESLKRNYGGIGTETKGASPAATPNRAPVRDPDDLPGLDY